MRLPAINLTKGRFKQIQVHMVGWRSVPVAYFEAPEAAAPVTPLDMFVFMVIYGSGTTLGRLQDNSPVAAHYQDFPSMP